MGSNPYGYAAGNCTWWVDHLAPWVDSYGNFGNAYNWLPHAQSQGLQTGRTPVPGALAVWGSNAPGSGGDGHVALVTAVQANGLPTVSEMNYRGLGLTDTRDVDQASAKYLIGYIYPPNSAIAQASVQTAGASSSAGPSSLDTFLPAKGYQSLNAMVDNAVQNGGLGSTFYGPIVGFQRWISQATLLRRIGFSVAGIAMLWVGVQILRDKSPIPPMPKVIPV